MPAELLMAGAALMPLGFGLIPAFLPASVPVFVRWCLWLILLAVSASFVSTMRAAPQPFAAIAFGSFILSMALSLWVLLTETRRGGGRPKAAGPGS